MLEVTGTPTSRSSSSAIAATLRLVQETKTASTIEVRHPHPLLSELEPESRFYFVHSFYVKCNKAEAVLAETDYGGYFHSVVGEGNIMGAQFHPEKSHKYGMRLLKNYAEKVK